MKKATQWQKPEVGVLACGKPSQKGATCYLGPTPEPSREAQYYLGPTPAPPAAPLLKVPSREDRYYLGPTPAPDYIGPAPAPVRILI